MLRVGILAMLVVGFGCGERSPSEAEPPGYVGGARCAECHAEPARLWKGSHHDLAMQEATRETVLGDFADASFVHRGQAFDFLRRDDRFFVRTAGADGMVAEFEVTHTFGVEPLQQYLVPLSGGRLHALGVAWDTRPAGDGGQRWFHLHPDEAIEPGDVLHWTGPSGSWNTMCADCHSTGLQKGYEPASDSYTPTWSEIDVSCEACHGPGADHVAWAEAGEDPERRGRALVTDLGAPRQWRFAPGAAIAERQPAGRHGAEVETCAPCHSRRSKIDPDPQPGDRFLDGYHPALLTPGLYHADGQILDEVYVWGSFVQSRMYAAGVVCSDCHDPHSLAIEAPDAVCGSCHRSSVFASSEHHHHAEGSPGASCVACHMPERRYMVVDERRDHGFRIPRPDLSVSIGTPNACTDCHADQPPTWAAAATQRWYGSTRASPPHFGVTLEAGRRGVPGAPEQLGALAGDPSQPGLVRATALQALGEQLTPRTLYRVLDGLRDPDPLVRMAAVAAAEPLPANERWRALGGALRDDLRAVRIEAARVLAPVGAAASDPQDVARLDAGLAEYRASQYANADMPSAHVNLGILYAQMGELDAAAEELATALRIGPYFLPAYVNLAELHRMREDDAAGEGVLRQALERFPESAEVHHVLGLLFVRQERMPEALTAFASAARFAPANPRYAYVHGIALSTAGQRERGLAVLTEAHRAHPGSPELLVALATLERDAGRTDAALDYARKLLALRPDDRTAQALMRELGGSTP